MIVFEKKNLLKIMLTIVNEGSSLTIVNEGSSLMIVNKRSSLTIINETMNYIKQPPRNHFT